MDTNGSLSISGVVINILTGVLSVTQMIYNTKPLRIRKTHADLSILHAHAYTASPGSIAYPASEGGFWIEELEYASPRP